MGTLLSALLHLQSIERQLAHVRGRLKSRKNAVAGQEKRINQLQEDQKTLHDKTVTLQKNADRLNLDLRTQDALVEKLRTTLNTAKTNKEYSAVLTQINTQKADNAKIEEEILKIMGEIDAVKAEADKIGVQFDAESKRLAEVTAASQDEINKLDAMFKDLTAQRAEAAQAVPHDTLAHFDRIAESYEGDAMAVIEIHGRKSPFEYVCGGCFMSLNAEHANALRTRDEIRTCNNCGRILYMEPKTENSPA